MLSPDKYCSNNGCKNCYIKLDECVEKALEECFLEVQDVTTTTSLPATTTTLMTPTTTTVSGEKPVKNAYNSTLLGEKIDNQDRDLSSCEFIAHLKNIEASNPGTRWENIISKMHENAYQGDSDLVILGIPLFKNGQENEGWENVDLTGHNTPLWVTTQDGNLINMHHTYAAVRAGVNRGSVNGWFMTQVNTGWGDIVMIPADWLEGGWEIIKGTFTLDSTQVKKGFKQVKDSPGRWSGDQRRGNGLGKDAQSYMEDNPRAKLSEAYAHAFKDYDEPECP